MKIIGVLFLFAVLLCSQTADARWPHGVGSIAVITTNFVVNDANEQFVNDAGEPWVTP